MSTGGIIADEPLLTVTGIVLKHTPVGDYDYSVTVFTREKGRISAFARGARRVGTRLSGVTEPFCFGEFEIYAGRNSFNIREAHITNYFEELRSDLEGSLYGSFFLEMADYYGRENIVDVELLKLLYQSLRAVSNPSLDRKLVRAVFEIRSLAIEGEFPGIESLGEIRSLGRLLPATEYAVNFAVSTPIERLYTFAVTPEVQSQLTQICRFLRNHFIDRQMKSLEILEGIQ